MELSDYLLRLSIIQTHSGGGSKEMANTNLSEVTQSEKSEVDEESKCIMNYSR